MIEKDILIERIKKCPGAVYYRWGFGWKGAEWHRTTKERLIAALESGGYANYDVCTVNGCLGINFYTLGDMD